MKNYCYLVRHTIITAAFGLTMSATLASAQSAQSVRPANILISSVPYAITAPGTYVLTQDLTFSPEGGIYQAILIDTNVQGPVVLDLNGFTLTGSIAIGNGTAPNTYPITIKNGKLSGGLGTTPGGTAFPATKITVDNVTFLDEGIIFTYASSSTVENCTFSNGGGIADYSSPGGNRYLNLVFKNNYLGTISVASWNSEIVPVSFLKECEFAPPAK